MHNQRLITLPCFCTNCSRRVTTPRVKARKYKVKLLPENFALCYHCVVEALCRMRQVVQRTSGPQYSNVYPGHEARLVAHSARIRTHLQESSNANPERHQASP